MVAATRMPSTRDPLLQAMGKTSASGGPGNGLHECSSIGLAGTITAYVSLPMGTRVLDLETMLRFGQQGRRASAVSTTWPEEVVNRNFEPGLCRHSKGYRYRHRRIQPDGHLMPGSERPRSTSAEIRGTDGWVTLAAAGVGEFRNQALGAELQVFEFPSAVLRCSPNGPHIARCWSASRQFCVRPV